jgi:DNA-binding NtrC family response regulator
MKRDLTVAPPYISSDNADIFHKIIHTMGNASMGVQLSGEKGLCKETIVRMLYARSPHCGSPFVKINCPVLSVTDGTDDRPCINQASAPPNTSIFSLFRLFHQGVLYFHAIDEMDPELQTRLLDLLRRKFHAFGCLPGGHKGGMLVFSTSSRPLEDCAAAGDVNPELCEMLSGLCIHIPPLRHSVDRIPKLMDYFINQCITPGGRQGLRQPSSFHLATINAYQWPGNVKELQEMVKTALRHDWDAAIRMLKRKRRVVDNTYQPVDLSPDGVALMPDFEIRQGRMLERLAIRKPNEEMGLMDLVIYDEVMTQNKVH